MGRGGRALEGFSWLSMRIKHAHGSRVGFVQLRAQSYGAESTDAVVSFEELLAALGGELGLYEVGEMADGLHGFQFSRLKLDAETRLDGDDKVDVVERVPLGDIRGGEAGVEDDGVFIKEIVKDGCQCGVEVLLLHLPDYKGLRNAAGVAVGGCRHVEPK